MDKQILDMKDKEWLRILMEDILRLAEEENKSPTIFEVMRDCKVQREDVLEAIKALEENKLVVFKNNKIILTSQGKDAASTIYKYHKIVEDLFGHTVAHSFEHLGESEIKLLEKEGNKTKALEDFEENEEGKVITLKIENPKILSRLMGVGIIPGKTFKTIKVREDMIILSIDQQIVILDRSLANKILGESLNESSVSWAA